MKIVMLILVFISSSYAVEITTIEFTNDSIMNYYISVFAYMTGVIVPVFGAFSLMGGR